MCLHFPYAATAFIIQFKLMSCVKIQMPAGISQTQSAWTLKYKYEHVYKRVNTAVKSSTVTVGGSG